MNAIYFLIELSDAKLMAVDFYQFSIIRVINDYDLQILDIIQNNNKLPIGCCESKEGNIIIIYMEIV